MQSDTHVSFPEEFGPAQNSPTSHGSRVAHVTTLFEQSSQALLARKVISDSDLHNKLSGLAGQEAWQVNV